MRIPNPGGGLPEEIEYTPDEHVARLQLYAEDIFYDEGQPDPFRTVCCGAISRLLTNRRAYDELMHNLEARVNSKPDENLTTWGLERLVTTAFHMEAWERAGNDFDRYQQQFSSIGSWEEVGEDMLGLHDNASKPAINFLMAIRGYDLNTIKEGRRAPMEFILRTLGNRWDEPINILDNGASRGDLLLMTTMNEPLLPITITGTENDHLYSDLLNQLLRSRVKPLGKKTNVDLHPLTDEVVYGGWFVSNYLRFSKSQDVILRARCKRFGDMGLRVLHGVDHIATNFSADNFQIVQKSKDTARFSDRYHIIQNSFSLDQQRHKSRLNALSRLHSLLTHDGVSLITGVVQVNPDDPMDPHFPDTDKSGVRTLIFDNTRPKLGYQELFSWEDGECRKGQIGTGEVSAKIWSQLLRAA